MKTATELLAWIEDGIANGKTVYVRNALRCTKVTPATAKKFAAINRAIFKATDKSLYMTSGNRYVCIDFNRIDLV